MATLKEQELRQARRNNDPHAEAVAAMTIWSEDYAFKQRGGVMDFWDTLPEYRKGVCRSLVKRIRETKTEEGSAPLVKVTHQ